MRGATPTQLEYDAAGTSSARMMPSTHAEHRSSLPFPSGALGTFDRAVVSLSLTSHVGQVYATQVKLHMLHMCWPWPLQGG